MPAKLMCQKRVTKISGASKTKKGLTERTPSCLSNNRQGLLGGDGSILLATHQGMGTQRTPEISCTRQHKGLGT